MTNLPFSLPASWPKKLRDRLIETLSENTQLSIKRAVALIDSLDPEVRGPKFTLGISSTFTISPQKNMFELAAAILPAKQEIVFGSFNALEYDLIDKSSTFHKRTMSAVLVLWRLQDLAPNLVYSSSSMSTDKRQNVMDDIIQRIHTLVSGFTQQSNSPLFLATMPATIPYGRALIDLHMEAGVEMARQTINLELLKIASNNNSQVHIFDFANWAGSQGEKAFDIRMDLFASQPLASSSLTSFSGVLNHHLTPLIRPSKKVLALDLDNTLWGGVLGEDGIANLNIGHEFPGNVYRQIQLLALSLKNQGVLLVMLSKNNLNDVEEAFEALSDMPLSLDDFTVIKADWQEKFENIKDVAQELNLGLNSFVFMDDQPFEREQMSYHLPEITVLAVSKDPITMRDALMNSSCFASYRLSKEDLERTSDYKIQSERRNLEKQSTSKTDFLLALNLEATICSVNAGSLGRVVQMCNKTNQFNVTTIRHSEADIQHIREQPRSILLTLSLRDRFSDQGIVGLIIALPDENNANNLILDSFLMSCRALGRGAEKVLWSAFMESATQNKFTSITARYIPTKKNSQCSALFDELGLNLELDNGSRTYTSALPVHFLAPEWINAIKG